MYFSPRRAISIAIVLSALSFSLPFNSYAAPCDANFTSSGNIITGSTYKTFSELPNVSAASAFEGALADIAKESSWKILAQDKSKGIIQAVQAESYIKGKVIPLNITIVPAGSGAKINMDYVTPTGSLSPASAVKNQFCQTIAAAENFAGVTPAIVAVVADVNSPANTNNVPRQLPGSAMITSAQQNKIAKELAKKIAQKQLQDNILDAGRSIQPLLELRSCTKLFGRSEISPQNIYAAPGVDFYMFGMGVPMTYTKYHNKNQCLSVAKIQGWKAPALNALQFEVLYLADDSGETRKENYQIVRQPDGAWLFTY